MSSRICSASSAGKSQMLPPMPRAGW
jgi:hypothetical protein